jgi:hypothetical protein
VTKNFRSTTLGRIVLLCTRKVVLSIADGTGLAAEDVEALVDVALETQFAAAAKRLLSS